jgi:hypothetical protein
MPMAFSQFEELDVLKVAATAQKQAIRCNMRIKFDMVIIRLLLSTPIPLFRNIYLSEG